MYVCNCNGISDQGVRAAIQAGANSWHEVHAHHGCTPCCGRCEPEIEDAIAAHRTERPSDAATHFRSPEILVVT